MSTYVQPKEELPEFPPCQVKGHDHELVYFYTVEQVGTGERAYLLGCPTNMYRFMYLPKVWEELGRMAKYIKPTWGWPKGIAPEGWVNPVGKDRHTK